MRKRLAKKILEGKSKLATKNHYREAAKRRLPEYELDAFVWLKAIKRNSRSFKRLNEAVAMIRKWIIPLVRPMADQYKPIRGMMPNSPIVDWE